MRSFAVALTSGLSVLAVVVGMFPRVTVKLIAAIYPPSHPRRRQLLADFGEVPAGDRLCWILGLVEMVVTDAAPARLRAMHVVTVGAWLGFVPLGLVGYFELSMSGVVPELLWWSYVALLGLFLPVMIRLLRYVFAYWRLRRTVALLEIDQDKLVLQLEATSARATEHNDRNGHDKTACNEMRLTLDRHRAAVLAINARLASVRSEIDRVERQGSLFG